MKTLQFKNRVRLGSAIAICASIISILFAIISYVVDCIFSEKGDDEYLKLLFISFGSILAFIWLIFLLAIIFSGRIIIGNDGIQFQRFGKIVWSIKKEEIKICIYNELHWWHFLMPIAAFNAGDLQFKLQNGKISKHYCTLSKRQVNKIKENFSYPFGES